MPSVKRIIAFAATVAALCAAASPQAQALSLCSLLCSCTISTATLGFGSYNPISNAAVTAAGNVVVSCQLLSGIVYFLEPYTVSLSKGQSGSFAPRSMPAPSSSLLNYNLYSNAGMTTVWGDGSGGTQYVSSLITVTTAGVNVNQSATIYGLVPAAQNARLGMSSDAITATVTY
jgi:spore coat protein U-like protein